MKALFDHQVEAVAEIVKLTDPERGRVAPGCMLLAHEMRLGKTRTAIESAQQLHAAGEVDRVVVVCPAGVRGVWADPWLGQVAEYSTVPVVVTEYRAKSKTWHKLPGADPVPGPLPGPPQRVLAWTVTNYEFVRRPERLAALMGKVDRQTMLVLDESSAVSSPSAAQTKACYKLRQRCGRALLLNGTPEGDDPGDMYAQFKVLDPAILGCRTWYEYRDRYAVTQKLDMGQRGRIDLIVGWKDLEELGRRTAPYVLKKATRDVLDMPQALDPVPMTVTLSPESWRLYKEMRDDCVAFLTSSEMVTAAQAAVKVMRLAQITSGFLGGVRHTADGAADQGVTEVREVGREKLDWLLAWVADRIKEDPAFKVVVWTRFRAEAERAAAALTGVVGHVGLLLGGQSDAERAGAFELLDPRTAPAGSAALVGTTRTGGMGREMSAAATMVYLSNEWSSMARKQSMARLLGPNQKRPCAYFDVVAEGPDGQRTVDHAVLKRLLKKEELGRMTAREWAAELGV